MREGAERGCSQLQISGEDGQTHFFKVHGTSRGQTAQIPVFGALGTGVWIVGRSFPGPSLAGRRSKEDGTEREIHEDRSHVQGAVCRGGRVLPEHLLGYERIEMKTHWIRSRASGR